MLIGYIFIGLCSLVAVARATPGSNCWYLALPSGSDPVSYDFVPPNVCYGTGWDKTRNGSQIYRIINDKLIELQNFPTNGKCEGIANSTKQYPASHYDMYANKKYGRDCGFIERRWFCPGQYCDQTPCKPEGFFWEDAMVTGVCDGAKTKDAIQVVKFCADGDHWGTYRFDGESQSGCTGKPFYKNKYEDGCYSGSDAQHGYYEENVYCQNYQ